MWKISKIMILLAVSSPAFAQDVTCTSDVPSDTCKTVSALFSLYQVGAHVVIADPVSFQHKKESMEERMKLNIRLGLWANPTMPNSYSENIMFERDDKSCPVTVFISTDAFRPVRVELEKEFNFEVLEGFDLQRVFPTALYVKGFVEGCNMGVALVVSDLTQKVRGKQ